MSGNIMVSRPTGTQGDSCLTDTTNLCVEIQIAQTHNTCTRHAEALPTLQAAARQLTPSAGKRRATESNARLYIPWHKLGPARTYGIKVSNQGYAATKEICGQKGIVRKS